MIYCLDTDTCIFAMKGAHPKIKRRMSRLRPYQNELEVAGKLIGSNDLVIAATAMVQGATLVTHNTDEFSRIKRLKTEDWI